METWEKIKSLYICIRKGKFIKFKYMWIKHVTFYSRYYNYLSLYYTWGMESDVFSKSILNKFLFKVAHCYIVK